MKYFIVTFLTLHFIITSAHGKSREVLFSDSQFLLELSYNAALYYAGPKISKSLERKKGHGIRKMPWQKFDDKMREVFHPSPYGSGVLPKEKRWNSYANIIGRATIYTTLVTPFFWFPQKEWLGAYLMILSCIETSFHINRSLRALLGRYRPRIMYQKKPAYNDFYKNSFPSGHASEAFSWAMTATLLFDLNFYTKIAVFSAASLASLGRLPGGQHYFTDLLAGAAVGTLVPWGVYQTLTKRKNQPNQEEKKVFFHFTPNSIQLSYHIN